MLWKKAFFNGLKKGLKIYAVLVVIIVPLFLLVTFLKHTSFFSLLEGSLRPFMGFLGLSGKATIVVITGFFVSMYGAVGIIPALGLGWKEITILGVMITICHEVIVEGGILKKMGGSPIRITVLRFALALTAGFVLNLVL